MFKKNEDQEDQLEGLGLAECRVCGIKQITDNEGNKQFYWNTGKLANSADVRGLVCNNAKKVTPVSHDPKNPDHCLNLKCTLVGDTWEKRSAALDVFDGELGSALKDFGVNPDDLWSAD